jgi:sulfur carrier protein
VKFVLNGEMQEAPAPLSVLELLARFELRARRVAVAINTEVVPRSRFAQVEIAEGDRVEVIQAVGGG